MILTRITIENFRQFFGVNDIRFAQPGPKNVTVILGTNGAGKTTLLNAITWCLYGKISMPQPDEILSHRAAVQLLAGGHTQALVELTFEADGKTYRARRSQKYRKKDDGALERTGSATFALFAINALGETDSNFDPYEKIEQLIPVGLSRFFFFRGEDMEALAGTDKDSEDRLRSAVETFLELRVLDRASDHLAKTGKVLEKKIRENASGETLALSDEIARVGEDRDATKALLLNLQNEERAARSLESSYERQLADFEELRPFVEDKNAKLVRQQELGKHISLLEANVGAELSRNAYLTLTLGIFDDVERFTADAIRSGELPAKIKPRFVDDLLEIGTCICGRALSDDARAALATFRSNTGVAGLEEAISSLRNVVVNMRGRALEYANLMATHRKNLISARLDARTLDSEISTLTNKLAGSPVTAEEIRTVQQAFRQARDAHRDCQLSIASTEANVRHLEERLKELKASREKVDAGKELVRQLERRRASVDRLCDVVVKLRAQWCDVVRRYLDIKLKDTWGRITQLPRVVEFNEAFELTISEHGPQGNLVLSAPSQANIRALALAFIGALISLAKEVSDYVTATGDERMPYRGGIYGLVMDAPFATMDAHFKTHLPRGLVDLVPQLILVTSFDQWTGDIASVMGNSVDRAYVLELHNPRLSDSARTITINGRSVPYEVPALDASADWSVITEVS
jgi:DNA sulfur modification protein DndD